MFVDCATKGARFVSSTAAINIARAYGADFLGKALFSPFFQG